MLRVLLELLLILQKLLLVKLSHSRGLNLQFLDSLYDLYSMKTHSDSKIGLQVLISYMIKKRSIDTQTSYIIILE